MDFMFDLNTPEAREILERISLHCPEALHVYLHCVNRVSKAGPLYFSKKTIQEDMSYSWTKFVGATKKLAQENILEWHFFDQGICITLAPLE